MDQKQLTKTIKIALQKASGKPIDEAATIVAEYIGMVESILDDIPVSIRQLQESSEIRPSEPMTPSFQELPPLPPLDKTASTIRKYREYNELVSLVTSGMPASIEISKTKDGKTDTLTLNRSVTQFGQDEPGVVVAYMAKGQDTASACPKVTFWCTDEKLDYLAATKSAEDQAKKIYLYEPPRTPSSSRPPPQSAVRFGKFEEV